MRSKKNKIMTVPFFFITMCQHFDFVPLITILSSGFHIERIICNTYTCLGQTTLGDLRVGLLKDATTSLIRILLIMALPITDFT
jgi:hypothetical protein